MLQRAQSLANACEQRPDYHAHLGALLLALRQTQAAANALLAANMLGGGYSPGGASSQSNVLISPRNHIYQSHSSHSNNSLI
jgi:hypothetical protein